MGYSPWGRKELDTTEATEHALSSKESPTNAGDSGNTALSLGQKDPLE